MTALAAEPISSKRPGYRFSGHETFACRFAWLPKACALIQSDQGVLSRDDDSMVALGLGKNMVKSLRFWLSATGIATQNNGLFELTHFGDLIFGDAGRDPYLENELTPWLLHWKLSAQRTSPLFAWHFIFNCWPYPEFSRAEILEGMRRESRSLDYSHSDVTLSQHLDVFFHTYLPPNAGSVEDSLDCPLSQLQLLKTIGQRSNHAGRSEVTYGFNRFDRRSFKEAFLAFAITDYWQTWHTTESTLTLMDLAQGENSPGRVLRMNESEIREAVDAIAGTDLPPFTVGMSSIQYTLNRRPWSQDSLLERVYA